LCLLQGLNWGGVYGAKGAPYRGENGFRIDLKACGPDIDGRYLYVNPPIVGKRILANTISTPVRQYFVNDAF